GSGSGGLNSPSKEQKHPSKERPPDLATLPRGTRPPSRFGVAAASSPLTEGDLAVEGRLKAAASVVAPDSTIADLPSSTVFVSPVACDGEARRPRARQNDADVVRSARLPEHRDSASRSRVAGRRGRPSGTARDVAVATCVA